MLHNPSELAAHSARKRAAFLGVIVALLAATSPALAQDDSVEVECQEPLTETTVTGELVAIKELDGSPWEGDLFLQNVPTDNSHIAIVGTARGEVAITVLGRGDLLIEGDRYEFEVSQYLLTSESDVSSTTTQAQVIPGLEGLEFSERVTDIAAEEPTDTALADIATINEDNPCLELTSIRQMSSDGPIDIEIPPGIVERLQNSYPKILMGSGVFAALIFIFGREPRG